MTNNEFSDVFTTLLNSYNTQARFGEQASKQEIVLDEYEKSVLLTQAQDLIVKSYFDATLNPYGQGFDDSTRRQVDFSSLIKVEELSPILNVERIFQIKEGNTLRGYMSVKNLTESPITIEFVFAGATTHPFDVNTSQYIVSSFSENRLLILLNKDSETVKNVAEIGAERLNLLVNQEVKNYAEFNFTKIENVSILPNKGLNITGKIGTKGYKAYDSRGVLYAMPESEDGRNTTDVLFILNEKLIYKKDNKTKEFVIVPINYREYDREMSKPYAQPLKKQAWRLFQNIATGFDVNSELIPKWNLGTEDLSNLIYRIRYVRRPAPIILEDLPEDQDLTIDGVRSYSECELNPILHMDILNKAVELAIASRGNRPIEQPQQERRER